MFVSTAPGILQGAKRHGMVGFPVEGLQTNGGETGDCPPGVPSVSRHSVWIVMSLEGIGGLGGSDHEDENCEKGGCCY